MDSSSRIEAARTSYLATGTLAQHKPAKVFDTDLFDTFVARLVRKHLVSQYVDESHEVLQEELKLLEVSRAALSAHLDSTVPEWRLAWRLAKMAVIQHIRRMAYDRLCLHDVDDETREETLERVYREDFEDLFPKSWTDA